MDQEELMNDHKQVFIGPVYRLFFCLTLLITVFFSYFRWAYGIVLFEIVTLGK